MVVRGKMSSGVAEQKKKVEAAEPGFCYEDKMN
jgi:hypothetical protein